MPTADDRHAFPKDRRLKSSLLIKETVQQRQSLFCFPIKCFYLIRECSETPLTKAAFLVSKKRFAHAVDRNRVKRLMREAYRLHQWELQPPGNHSLLLCWMFVGDTLPASEKVESAVCQILAKLSEQNDTGQP